MSIHCRMAAHGTDPAVQRRGLASRSGLQRGGLGGAIAGRFQAVGPHGGQFLPRCLELRAEDRVCLEASHGGGADDPPLHHVTLPVNATDHAA